MFDHLPFIALAKVTTEESLSMIAMGEHSTNKWLEK
jgi:hypothetical protein